jgi:isoleucyl-tRNA synthetase
MADSKPNYKDTLNLPKTDFPMAAKLVENEPKRLAKWRGMGLYERLLDSRKDAPLWVLHDGPPFANGDIHIGHVINKTLKDVFLRWHSLKGERTPYVPGWDCHGLPIEHKIQQELGPKIREMSTVDVRRRCWEYADKYVNLQCEQFQRLGILGDWSNPYITMKPAYEASTLEVFARFVEAGLVYKQLKPVYWSISNQTALADAEIEYQDREDPSVYVLFDVANPEALPASLNAPQGATVSLMIWTTTPWTLPANLAVAVAAEGEYQLIKYDKNGKTHHAILVNQLVKRVMEAGKAENVTVLGSVPGSELTQLRYRHPFIDRVSPVVLADYVTFEDGTGLVHTAPGHGEDDYNTGIREGLEIYSPVMANGKFDDTVPDWLRGQNVWDANKIIPRRLDELGKLFHQQMISHSYPHDWRSKTPTIFRATEQWFIAMDHKGGGTGGPPVSERSEQKDMGEPPMPPQSLRARAQRAASNEITFIPRWGQARLQGMLESRPDWCISRQRAWGLPIPVFYNEQGEALLTPESVRAVAKRFAEKGSDAWFTDSPAELLGDYDPGPRFPKDKLRKERDIFDVWFESGSSWHAVLMGRDDLCYPADLYLEGSDQHRGWFQLSLLPALGATGQPPFRQVLTHGFIVDPEGKKVSKSDKNYVTATKEINTHGADLLRLWTCSVDYETDIRTSPETIKEFGDKYRKIRNTLRYLLSNLYDFDPSKDAVTDIPPSSLDGWALAQLDTFITETSAAYDAYQLHRAFRLLHDFCSVQISAVYGNAMKDRLYCEAPNSELRRRCQTVMHRMAVALVKLLSPMLVFTADEAWEYLQRTGEDASLDSVHLSLKPEPSGVAVTDEQLKEWELLMELRESALQQLDALKKNVGLNKALDAEVIFSVDDDAVRQKLQAYGVDLADMVGAGYHSFAEAPISAPAASVKVIDRRADYPACARSWKRRPDVGQDKDYPDLSLRDAQAVKALRTP